MLYMVGMAARRARWGTLPAAALLLVAGCSGETAGTTTFPPPTSTSTVPDSTTTTSTTLPTTTTTTLPATTTTADPLARPDVLVSNVNRDSIEDFDTSKDNVYEAAMELRDLFVFLEGNPTDDAKQMMSLLFERNYPYWNPIMVGFLELTDNPGWHYSDPGVKSLGIEVVELERELAVVRIADVRPEQIITDGSGQVVKEYDGWQQRVSEFTLRRGADGLWRYADVSPSEPISDEELRAMVQVEWIGRQP